MPEILLRPDHHTLAYHCSPGDGPGVIFMGGFLSDMTGSKALTLEAWCRQQGLAFVRFDYHGHGASSGRFEDGTIGRWSEDAIAVLDQLTQGPQILIGSSMGAWMMLLTALARPQRIAGLIGIAAAPDFTEDLLWQGLDKSKQSRLLIEGMILLPSDYNETPYPITLELIEEARQHLLLRETLPLSCPVRLLHGMNDSDVPWETSIRLAQQLNSDDVQVTLVKDGDHRLSEPQNLALLIRNLAELRSEIAVSSSIGHSSPL